MAKPILPALNFLSKTEREAFRLHLENIPRMERLPRVFDLVFESRAAVIDKRREKEITAAEISIAIHGVYKKSVYDLFDRLEDELDRFIAAQRTEADVDGLSELAAQLSAGEFFLEKQAYELALVHVKAAEEIAIKLRRPDVRHVVLGILIRNCAEFNLKLDDLTKERRDNRTRCFTMEHVDMTCSFFLEKVKEYRAESRTFNMIDLVHNAVMELKLETNEENDLSFMLPIVMAVRATMASMKDYKGFETFVLHHYHRLKDAGAFPSGDTDYLPYFLYMIAHMHYRNLRFREARTWLDQLEAALPVKNFKTFSYYPKNISLKAAILSYSGDNDDAIALLEKMLNGEMKYVSSREKVNMLLNLGVYYFYKGDFSSTIKTLNELMTSEEKMMSHMAPEWHFKFWLIRALALYELGRTNEAGKIIERMQRDFQELLSRKIYQRAKTFVGFIKRICKDPGLLNDEKFIEEVRASNLGVPEEGEDIQAIAFFCWLAAKIKSRIYYNFLLDKLEKVRGVQAG